MATSVPFSGEVIVHVCSVDGCDRSVHARGLCNTCYRRLARSGPLPPSDPRPSRKRTCQVSGCDRPHKGHGYCGTHLARLHYRGPDGLDPAIDRRPTTPPMRSDAWTRENLAWAAGLFEGEGTITNSKGRQWTAAVGLTDEDVVLRFASIFPGGSIAHHPIRSGKTHVVWRIHGPKVYAFVVAVWPWLGERRRRRAREFVEAFLGR